MACLVFALVGVPLGITAHRRETSFGFGASLVIGVFYFLFIIVADTLRANPKLHPEFLVWLPNVLFLGLGVWMFRRLSKR
jgi:lipopolysaccharide export system permease protein